ncbi:MAG: DEDD exonuclease domain-containing protein [Candidatus Nanopelagicaceae bacterium]|nr:DEDD exonuclease domain-containing protein [Candidatus Nanopelagicaceae bacterium]
MSHQSLKVGVMKAAAGNEPWQATFDEIGQPLSQTTFVVVDLETTGASPSMGAGITEIGAVKVRGGEIIGEFQTLVNPGGTIPAFITVLTGITDAMVLDAPSMEEALPTFLEFMGSGNETILVAHNAPFDVGFLKASAAHQNYTWPQYRVVDTARLARQVLLRDEVPNCKLGTLALFFNTQTSPTHRALDDARATVDVLHGLLERLGSFGVTTLDELTGFSTRISKAQREKKHLIASIPAAPGVYIFKGPKDEPLYVGTSRNLRSRLRTYFTANETRKRILEMLAIATQIDTIVCATVLEAQVRELRIIAEKRPPYNSRSKGQEKATWLKVSEHPFPRFAAFRGSTSLNDSMKWIGPFSGAVEAQLASQAVTRALSSPGLYDSSDVRPVVDFLNEKMTAHAIEEEFELAVAIRDQLGAFLRGSSRGVRIRTLTRIPELIAAQRIESPTIPLWEFVCIRYGRLAGSAVSKPGVEISHTIESLLATSEVVVTNDSILPASTYEEVEKILNHLETDGIRLISLTGEWASPINGAIGAKFALEKTRSSDQVVANFWESSIQRVNN